MYIAVKHSSLSFTRVQVYIKIPAHEDLVELVLDRWVFCQVLSSKNERVWLRADSWAEIYIDSENGQLKKCCFVNLHIGRQKLYLRDSPLVGVGKTIGSAI